MFFQTNLTDGGVQLFLRLALLCAAFALALAGCASDGSDESAGSDGSTTSTAGYYGKVGGDVFLSQNELVTAIENASGTMTLQLGPRVGNTDLETIGRAINNSPNLSSVRLDLSNATSVTSIGGDAFQSCTKLESVTIPSSVTSMGEYAFGYCNSLTSATISSSVIGGLAFYGCNSLTSVTISSSVTSIGRRAFGYCNSLTSVTFENPNGWYKRIDETLDTTRDEPVNDVSNAGSAAIYIKNSLEDNYLLRNP